MPELNGYEVCRHLKAQERTKDVPVIFLTALTDTVDKVRAFEAGGVDYVTKPFQIEEVLARVKTHVALRRAQAGLADSYTRLRAVEQLRDDLVHMVVHDLRSPLGALLINLRLLEAAATLGDDDQQILQSAIESAEAIERMANTMLDVSRLEAAKMPWKPAEWDLAQMARDVRAALGTSDVEPPRIDIESAGRRERDLRRRAHPPGHREPGQQRPQALAGGHPAAHLASRAATAARVSRSTTRGAACARTPGRRFSRSSERSRLGRTSIYNSVGLGLAFCKLAIEAHGGTIGVDPGVPAGSTFWFELPA